MPAPGDGLCLWHCLYHAMPHFHVPSACALHVAALEQQVLTMGRAGECVEAFAPATAEEEAFYVVRVRNTTYDLGCLEQAHSACFALASKLDMSMDPATVLDMPHHGDVVELNALLEQQECEVLSWSMASDAIVLMLHQRVFNDEDASRYATSTRNLVMLLHSVHGRTGHYDMISRGCAIERMSLTNVESEWKTMVGADVAR